MRSLLSLLILFLPLYLHAQQKKGGGAKKPADTQKELKKEWKKKAKMYVKNPLALKAREEGFQKQIQDRDRQIEDSQRRNRELSERMDQLEKQIQAKQYSYDSLMSEYLRLKAAYETEKKQARLDVMPGLVFKVQIGAFRLFDMRKYAQDNPFFETEALGDINRYTVGRFRDLALAEAFQKDLKRLGIRDAWIVPFKDGVRITMKEAKELLGQKGS
ncbi:MAG: SPOR domain-containing protein [Bacteroidia bacterium]|nr:SPOR domain-containing protein [Bacteroidia bacterium]